MPAITYADFSGGLDRRIPINVQDANRLWVLRNAYITIGKKIKKRPGLRTLVDTLDGSVGLKSAGGALNVFVETGGGFITPTVPGVPLSAIELDRPPSLGDLSEILFADMFQGFMYVVADYEGTTWHHYVDGATTYISDSNCPQSAGVTKAASRIFAPSGENVRYCAAGDARDWTTASDAGFLPAGLQQDTKDSVVACGSFQDSLVVFFPEAMQIWAVAIDPSANQIRKRIYGTGTTEPVSLASFASDLMFLSPYGFRSAVVQQNVDRIDDVDTGVPIDGLVRDDIESLEGERVRAVWIPQFGQYWAIFNYGTTCKAWVYSYSKTSKLATWSEYTFPDHITDVATLNGQVFARSATRLFEVMPDSYVDTLDDASDESIDAEVQMAYQDAKSPGVLKQFNAGDFVFSGSWEVSYKYDPRDQSKETIPQTISGDTRPGELIPVEVSAPAIAPVFRHSGAEAAEIDAVTLYYETLGLMG